MNLRVMAEQDIPGGVHLNTVAGWNQTAADWRRFLGNSPHGCFAMEHDNKVVGTVTTISYEDRFAWIGMVLVDPEYRKQGIGTKLLGHAIDYLDDVKIRSMKLDATPLGKSLYEKLGFVTEYDIERWILRRPPNHSASRVRSDVARLNREDLEELLDLDRELFGADRKRVLRSLQDAAPEFALALRENGMLAGYSFGRHGLFADHLGPWMAVSGDAAEKIAQTFLTESRRETIIVDCLKDNRFASHLLKEFGFTASRPLTRMFRGTNEYPGRADRFCGILGPEFG